MRRASASPLILCFDLTESRRLSAICGGKAASCYLTSLQEGDEFASNSDAAALFLTCCW
jgi:hypothetical protein